MEGLASPPSDIDLSIHYLSGKYYSDISEFFDKNTGTFEITGAGANETAYVCIGADYSGSDIYQYNVVNTGGGGSINYVVLPANANKTIDATVSLPSGYFNKYACVYIYHDQTLVGYGGYVDSTANPIIIDRLPGLISGDSYCYDLGINHPTANNYFKKNFFYTSAEAQNINMNLYSLPTLSFITHPASGETLTATTSFEWQAVGWATYYDVQLSGVSSSFSWIGYTTDTSIKIPASVFNIMPSGSYYVDITAVKDVNFPGLNMMNVINSNEYFDCMLYNTEELIITEP